MDEILEQILQLIDSGEELSDELLGLVVELLESEPEPIESPMPPGVEQLWVLSGENPQAFTQYLQTFPDPAFNALANNPTQLQGVINRLQQQITQPAGEVQDGIPKAPLNSSNVYGINYDPRSSRLRVRFNSGSVYQYDAVPPQVFKIFQKGAIAAKTDGQNKWGRWWKGKEPSLGAAFHQLIRDRFPYRKLR